MNIHVAYLIAIVCVFILGWIFGTMDRLYSTDGHIRIERDWKSRRDYLIYSPNYSIEEIKKKQYMLFSVYNFADRIRQD